MYPLKNQQEVGSEINYFGITSTHQPPSLPKKVIKFTQMVQKSAGGGGGETKKKKQAKYVLRSV